jgi:hypothetical protein
MPQPDLDPVERQALAFIVGELEEGHLHACVDTFLPFLKSCDADHRLVAILRYFEELGILTPEWPMNRSSMPPLALGVIPAYWRIEGRAVSLDRELKRGPEESKRPKEGKRRRGRHVDTDPAADKRIFDAWQSGEHKEYADLGRSLGMSSSYIAKAIDRHRHRLARDSARRRTNPSDN